MAVYHVTFFERENVVSRTKKNFIGPDLKGNSRLKTV